MGNTRGGAALDVPSVVPLLLVNMREKGEAVRKFGFGFRSNLLVISYKKYI